VSLHTERSTYRLGYADPSLRTARPPATPPLVLALVGGVLCGINLLGAVGFGGAFLLAPLLGFLSFLVFAVGVVAAAVMWQEGRAMAGAMVVWNLAGCATSLLLSCVGVAGAIG
jgi:hypothetical protein